METEAFLGIKQNIFDVFPFPQNTDLILVIKITLWLKKQFIFCFIAVHCCVQIYMRVMEVLQENDGRVHKIYGAEIRFWTTLGSRRRVILLYLFLFFVSYFDVWNILSLKHMKIKPRPL